jgi:hypothetical protein
MDNEQKQQVNTDLAIGASDVQTPPVSPTLSAENVTRPRKTKRILIVIGAIVGCMALGYFGFYLLLKIIFGNGEIELTHGTQKAYELVATGIEENCSSYTSYYKNYFGGGEGEDNGAFDIGSCDGEWTENWVSKSGIFSKFEDDAFRQSRLILEEDTDIREYFSGSLKFTVAGGHWDDGRKSTFVIVKDGQEIMLTDGFKDDYINIQKSGILNDDYRIWLYFLPTFSEDMANQYKAAVIADRAFSSSATSNIVTEFGFNGYAKYIYGELRSSDICGSTYEEQYDECVTYQLWEG